MLTIQLILSAVALFATVNSQDCEMIRVDKGDDYGTIGTCCVTWNEERVVTARKFLPGMFGGFGLGGGISGYLNDSSGRNYSGGIGGVVGPGLMGNPATPPPQLPTPPPSLPAAPPAYPPPAYPQTAYPPQGYPPQGYGPLGYPPRISAYGYPY